MSELLLNPRSHEVNNVHAPLNPIRVTSYLASSPPDVSLPVGSGDRGKRDGGDD